MTAAAEFVIDLPAMRTPTVSQAGARLSSLTQRHMALFALAVLMGLANIASSSAQDASDWDAQAHSATRLIAGAMSKDGDATFLRAGIEIKLGAGWKTYWRDPGDSGAPPIFDFSASENVKSVSVLWPAPHRFPDGAGGNSIGYVDHLILPLHVVTTDAAKQTALRLKLAYAVCANICIPVEANLALRLGRNGAEDEEIERAEIRVPRHVALGQQAGGNIPRDGLAPGNDGRGGALAYRAAAGETRDQNAQIPAGESASRKSDALAIVAVRREPGGAHDRVAIDLAAPPGAPVDLFVEGPTPDWSLPLPVQTAADGAIRHFAFDLDGLPPNAKAEGAALTLTAVSGDDAIEVTAHLD
jgi:DsbC/DsbD-like thiol-disulfide interchange protein